MTARITIEDINDNKPIFHSRSEVIIAEDEPVGYPLLVVAATDLDKNNSIRYTIVGGNVGRTFALESDTGELSICHTPTRSSSYHTL